MKIAIIRNADTSNFGGAETYVLELCRQLDANDIDTVVATALPRLRNALAATNSAIVSSPWLNWQRWHGIFTPLVLLLHGPWIIRLIIWYFSFIREHQPDILHPMNRDDWIAATIAGKIKHIPVIWTDHADLKHEIHNVRGIKNLLGKVVLFWAKKANAIMVVSKAEKAAIKAATGNTLNKQISVVYNGVSSQSYAAVPTSADALIIGITARLRNQKGLRELIDAFERLTPPANKKLELWLIGDGPDELELRERAADPRVKFLGFKDNWLNYVAACDIFAFPSYTEGFSLSLLEAAMLSRPIVATDVGGNPEVILHEKTGLLVESKNVPSLAHAIQQLIDDPSLASTLGENAHQLWKSRFQFNQIVSEKIIPLYQNAIDDQR